LSTEEDLVAHLENKQTQDPTLQISSVQACDNPSTDANDVPSEASLDIVQCAVCEMPCFDFMKCSVCNKFAHELCSKSEASNAICQLRSNEKEYLQKGHKLLNHLNVKLQGCEIDQKNF
jgi:hypothetical protein